MKMLVSFIGCLLLVLAIVALAEIFTAPDRFACYSRWSASGHDSSFGVFAGCRVQIGGQWIPEQAVRNINP